MYSQQQDRLKNISHTQAVALKDRLSFRMLLQLLVMIAVVLAVILLVLSSQLTSLMDNNIKKEIASLAEHNANLSQEYFNTMQTQASSLATAVSKIVATDMAPPDKQSLMGAIMNGVLNDQRIFSVYTAWEPNLAFPDTPDGYSYYIYRTETGLVTDILNDYAVYRDGDYYATSKKTNAPHMTEPYPYELTNGQTVWLISISNPMYSQSGKFLGVTNCDVMADTINGLNYSLGEYQKAYSYTLSHGGAYLSNTRDKGLMGSAFGEGMKDRKERSEILSMTASGQGKQWEHADDILGEDAYIVQTPVRIEGLNEPLASLFAVSKPEALSKVNSILLVVLLLSLLEMAVIGAGVVLILKRALRPMQGIISIAESMERGELQAEAVHVSKDEFGHLARVFQKTASVLRNYVEEISSVLGQLAEGDLRVAIQNDYKGDFAPIKAALQEISSSLNHTLLTINTAAGQVSTGAAQVSSGAQALAAGSAEQASSIEELSASVTKIADQAAENSGHVTVATQYVEQAGAGINAGNLHMQRLTEAMENIGSSSSQIASITKVIEDIAFQTNILALNAAIEAARAGSAGKGFAVVADEVRNLAAKSAEAAKQTAELIRRSTDTVAEGSQIAVQTAQILNDVEVKAHMANDSIAKINQASLQQAAAIEQIKQGLTQVSSVVQMNAATAEENSATSEEMSAQAATLRDEVGKFKLDTDFQKDTIAAISLLKEPYQANKAELKSASALGKY